MYIYTQNETNWNAHQLGKILDFLWNEIFQIEN